MDELVEEFSKGPGNRNWKKILDRFDEIRDDTPKRCDATILILRERIYPNKGIYERIIPFTAKPLCALIIKDLIVDEKSRSLFDYYMRPSVEKQYGKSFLESFTSDLTRGEE